MSLLYHHNPIALWHHVIHEASHECSIELQEELKAYLVSLLQRYTNKPECIQQVIATLFLKNLKAGAKQRQLAFQEVGDHCLLFTGLFPQISSKRLVSIRYFIHMGQRAYYAIAHQQGDVFALLADQFVAAMDVLQSIRVQDRPELLPLDVYDLWNEENSQKAYQLLKQYSAAIPLIHPPLKHQ